MRPITALVRADLVRADLSGIAPPILEEIAPSDLLIDDVYQRNLSPKSIALIIRIVASWDWLKFKPPVVAMTEAGLEVVDGQHSAIAAATLGLAKIPCMIVDGSKQEERAQAFVSHATNRLQATPTQVWTAAVAAGDEQAIQVRNVCLRAGVDLVPFPPQGAAYRPGQTIALAAIQKLIARRGPERAVEVLRALARAELTPVSADWIKAADVLLLDEEYATEMDGDRLTATIKALGPRAYADMRELAAAKHLPLWKAMVAVAFKNRAKGGQPRPSAEKNSVPTHQRFVERPSALPPTFGDPEPGRSALDQRRAAQ